MTLVKALIVAALLLLLPVAPALAAERGLLLLEDLSHSLGLTYDNSAQLLTGNGSHSSSTQNSFRESYDLGVNYAIVNPRILKGRISFTLSDQQDYTSSHVRNQAATSTSNNNLTFLYNVHGILLERGYTPLKVFATSDLERIQNSFGPGYTAQSDSLGVSTAIRNRLLPVSVSYTRNSSETSGLIRDRMQTNDQVVVRASHTIRTVSQTDLEIYRTDSRSSFKVLQPGEAPDLDRAFDATLKNSLTLQNGKYGLQTSVRMRDEVGLTNARYADLNEGFSWQLGPALSLGASYTHDNSSQVVVGGSGIPTTLSRTSDGGSFNIVHRLFLNFTSRLDLSARSTDIDNGTEKEYTGNLGLFYTKNLPEDSHLTLNFNEIRDITDRALTSDLLHTIDEPMTVQALDPTRPQNLHSLKVDESTIVVRDANPLVRVLPYVRGIDYEVVTTGVVTALTFEGPEMTVGKNLLVSYDSVQNQSIKYQTVTHRLGGSYDYHQNLKFFASVSKTDQTLLSGSADQVSLDNSLEIQVGAAMEQGNLSYGVEDTYLDSTLDKHSFYEGFLKYATLLYQGRFACQVRDRYAIYGVTPSNPREYSENLFNLNANYTRALFGNSSAIFTGTYTDSRGGAATRDQAELGLTFQWGYGKLFVKLNAKVDWIDLSGSITMSENVVLEVKRYF